MVKKEPVPARWKESPLAATARRTPLAAGSGPDVPGPASPEIRSSGHLPAADSDHPLALDLERPDEPYSGRANSDPLDSDRTGPGPAEFSLLFPEITGGPDGPGSDFWLYGLTRPDPAGGGGGSGPA